MRMWMINPKLLCRQHLLGEHVELHMLAGTIRAGKSIDGYINNRLVEPGKIYYRHAELVKEMRKRKYKHKSPLPEILCLRRKWLVGKVNIEENIKELKRRCPACRERINNHVSGNQTSGNIGGP